MITVLMIEVEPAEGISSRKLVLETAKHNVLTAYSAADGIALMQRFPAVDAVVVHAMIGNDSFRSVVEQIRKVREDVPIILISPSGSDHCPTCAAVISSHEPRLLLDILEQFFPAKR